MKVIFERVVFHDLELSILRKDEPWDIARVRMYKNGKYIAFIVKRSILLTKHFKKIYKKAKLELDKEG